jgi:hypothetical protein
VIRVRGSSRVSGPLARALKGNPYLPYHVMQLAWAVEDGDSPADIARRAGEIAGTYLARPPTTKQYDAYNKEMAGLLIGIAEQFQARSAALAEDERLITMS